MEFEFTLKYQLYPSPCDADAIVERLGAGGCDDATVGIGQTGRLGLMFTRDAASAKEALMRAIVDVRHIVPAARLIEAGPDFVGLTDAAEMVGMTRQNLRKLMLANPSFPPPVHDGNTVLWHLVDLLDWLHAHQYKIDPATRDVAAAARLINSVNGVSQIPMEAQKEVAELVG